MSEEQKLQAIRKAARETPIRPVPDAFNNPGLDPHPWPDHVSELPSDPPPSWIQPVASVIVAGVGAAVVVWALWFVGWV